MSALEIPTHPSKRPTRAELIASETHGKHFVFWMDITADNRRDYLAALEAAQRERDLQEYLSKNPIILAQAVGGGHGRWVIPQFRFGSNLVADFVVGERHSFGYEWLLVELESPKTKMFTKKGDPTTALTHAIRQIEDWRSWIRKNIDYVSRPTENGGLGLIDIHDSAKGLILTGREKEITSDTHERRRQMCLDNGISIHTY